MIFENMKFKNSKRKDIRNYLRKSIRNSDNQDYFNKPQSNILTEPKNDVLSDLFLKPVSKEKPKAQTSAQESDFDELEDFIKSAGYAYDEKQDIFYSVNDPWQRNVGYCRLYDEASAPLGMIIDCEPIYFEYDNRKWMISFWKGQYDLVSGAEIGIYTSGRELNVPGIFHGTFYNAVSDNERLNMSYTLKKNGKVMFTRDEVHWWLTGFKLGEYAEPSELTMDISITFKNEPMRDAFLVGFRKAGYRDKDFSVNGKEVSFIFDKPHSRQPVTRTKETDKIIQAKNKLLCDLYQEITGSAGDTVQEKFKALKEQSPELYSKLQKIGKNKQIFEVFYVLIMLVMFLLSFFTTGKNNIFSIKNPLGGLSN